MSVTGVSAAFSSLFRGNYSGCVAWRQQGPQAQLVGNTTQLAVKPLALTPASPPASPEHQNQTNRNLLRLVHVWNEKQNRCLCCLGFFFFFNLKEAFKPILSSLLLRHWNVSRDIFSSLDRCSDKNCYHCFFLSNWWIKFILVWNVLWNVLKFGSSLESGKTNNKN